MEECPEPQEWPLQSPRGELPGVLEKQPAGGQRGWRGVRERRPRRGWAQRGGPSRDLYFSWSYMEGL